MIPLSEVTEFGSGNQDPAINYKGGKEHNLRPPRAEKQVDTGVVVGDVGPVEGQIEKPHSAKSRSNEVGNAVVRCDPTEEGQGSEERHDKLWQKLPQRYTEQDAPEDPLLLASSLGGCLTLLLLCLE